MADGDGVECFKCKATSSMMWQKNQSGATICLDCYSLEKRTRSSKSPQRSGSNVSENSNSSSSSVQGQNEKTPIKQTTTVSTRRTTRARERNNRAKQQPPNSNPAPAVSAPSSPATNNGSGVSNKTSTEKINSKSTNGSHNDRDNGEDYSQKSGRSVQLKQGQPMKAPSAETMIVTSESIIHKGTTYEIGDVVSLLDRGGGIYYAVIRGFLQDQYAEKYAVLTWLLPRYPNPTHFDPADFILGPEEDIPRSMEVIEFVSHSPQSRYFQTSYYHDLEQAELWKH